MILHESRHLEHLGPMARMPKKLQKYQLANKIHLFGFLETHVGQQNAFKVIDKDCEQAGILLQLYLCSLEVFGCLGSLSV